MDNHYDAVVIGAGIQGAGCAQALAAAGHRVLVVEQATVGAGTSSRSSKLIHGGLRYLETGQFSLVKKSLRERALLQTLAPTLVKQKKFILPVYREQRLKPWQLRVGLSLYALLGGLKPDARFEKLSQQQCSQLSGLKQQGLVAAYQYQDAQTDDLALTQAVMRSAQTFDCKLHEHCKFTSARKNLNGHWEVSLCNTKNTAQAFDVTCKLIVNAAGPWVTAVQQQISGAPQSPAVALVKGSHIEIDESLGDAIYYLEAPLDQRAVFIMPWRGRTLIGTTEQLHSGPPESQQPNKEEIDYLLQTVEHYFPACKPNIVNSWSGLRVLPDGDEAKNTTLRRFSGRQRDTIVLADNLNSPRVITLYGGKLTTYRVTAEQVAQKAEMLLGQKAKRINTALLPLA